VKTSATGGSGQWWDGKGIVDGEVPGPATDFGLTLVGSAAGFGIGNPDTTITSAKAINDGQWHHLAAAWDGFTGRMQLYVDGGLEASAVGPTGTRSAPPGLRLGSIQAGYPGGFLAGTIDDVQLFGRALNATEVAGTMNHAPTLAPIPASSILAGRTLIITNTATDPAVPAETLTWSLLSAPSGAAIHAISPTNGVLNWRPTMAQSPSSNCFSVVVTDNGVPQLSATQSLTVNIWRPAAPQLLGAAWVSNSFNLQVTGDAGPDYILETATNLGESNDWIPAGTNLSATPPLHWTDGSASIYPQRFYRVLLGP
jgi:hypothetical protein